MHNTSLLADTFFQFSTLSYVSSGLIGISVFLLVCGTVLIVAVFAIWANFEQANRFRRRNVWS